MKKITSLVIAIFAMATSASAQYNVSGHRFFDNWSIGVDGGVTTNLRDFDTPNGGVAAIQLTKGITPVLSVQAEVQAGFNNWSNWNVNHSDCTVDNVTAALMAKVNLMNWFCGYKGAPRVFEISPKIGGGYMHYFYPEDTRWNSKNYRNAAVGKAGIDFDFNLGEKKAWTLSVKPDTCQRDHRRKGWQIHRSLWHVGLRRQQPLLPFHTRGHIPDYRWRDLPLQDFQQEPPLHHC